MIRFHVDPCKDTVCLAHAMASFQLQIRDFPEKTHVNLPVVSWHPTKKTNMNSMIKVWSQRLGKRYIRQKKINVWKHHLKGLVVLDPSGPLCDTGWISKGEPCQNTFEQRWSHALPNSRNIFCMLYVCMSIYLYLNIFIYIYNDILCNCVFNISRPRSPCDLATSVPNAPKHCALRWRWKRRRRRCLGQHGERHVRGAPRRCLVKRSLNGWLFRLVRRLHDQWFLYIYIYII